MKLTRFQEGALGAALVVDLVSPTAIVVLRMTSKMSIAYVIVFCALAAAACFGLMRLVDRQPGRLGLPESVTGPRVLAFVTGLVLFEVLASLLADSLGVGVLFAVVAVIHLSLLALLTVLAVQAGDSDLVGGVTWIWVILIIIGGGIGMLVFWYLNVWRAHDPVVASRLTSASS